MFVTRMSGSTVILDSRNATGDSRLLVAFESGDVLHLGLRPDLSEGLWVDDWNCPRDIRTIIKVLSKRYGIYHGYLGLRLSSPLEIGGAVTLDALLTESVGGWEKLRHINTPFPIEPAVLAVIPFSTEKGHRFMPYADRM